MTGIKYTEKQLINRWRELNEQIITASVDKFIEIIEERLRLMAIACRMGIELPMG
jgi:hypothetical protein